MPYELKLEQFTGPLDKLLVLIEARKMEITEISLAEVTDDFLRYLKTLTDAERNAEQRGSFSVSLRLLADFIAVASRLILIKSKFLLPEVSLTEGEETEIRDLEKRLKIYQELKPALKTIQRLSRAANQEFSRPYFLTKGISWAGASIFYPGNRLESKTLVNVLNEIFESFKGLEFETKTIKESIITIEEKIEEIIKRLKKEGKSRFKKLSHGKSRSEIIAIFLAVLHLAHEQLILLEQAERFSDIIIKKPQSKTQK